MGTRIPQNFRKSSQTTTLYNFVDTMQGVGILPLYAATDQTSASGGILTTSTTPSDDIQTKADVADTSYALKMDLDFDVTVNIPITFEGIASVAIPLYPIASLNGDEETMYGKVFAYIRKWDGTTETTLVSGASVQVYEYHESSAQRIGHESLVLLKLDVPNTTFKVGEVLRLTTRVLAYKGPGTPTNARVFIGHDPAGRYNTVFEGAGSQGFASPKPTQLILNMPVKIDI